MHVLIVGAGIFGVTGALALRARGHRVTLVDPGPLPHPLAASTDINKLVRADYGADDFYAELGLRAIAGWEAWNAGPGRPLYHPDGALLLTRSQMAEGGFEGDGYATLTARGQVLVRLDAAALQASHPQWTLGADADGYRNTRAGWAESGAVVSRLVDQARQAGVTLLEGERVSDVETVGKAHRADTVVVAAGAWTPTLLPWLADRLWATGQPMLYFRPVDPEPWRPPAFLPWAADIARTGFYGFPANADGLVKVANHGVGVRLSPDAPRELPADTEAHFRAFLSRSLPELALAPVVGQRLCLYCDTFDGDFWIDADPDRPGLVVAAGGAGHGFKFAPVLGDLVADAVEGTRGPFAHRFRWRERGELRTEGARGKGQRL